MWETLVAVLIGSSMSLGGVWLTSHLNIRERRNEHRAVAADQRRDFQRATLTELSAALTKTMRDTAKVHFADCEAAKTTGVYAGHLLPEGIESGNIKRAQTLAHLTGLVLDDCLRKKVSDLQGLMGWQGRPVPRTIQEGDAEFSHLIQSFDQVQTELDTAIRSLWERDDEAPRKAVRSKRPTR